jgi:uroporphyrinogen-III synthase
MKAPEKKFFASFFQKRRRPSLPDPRLVLITRPTEHPPRTAERVSAHGYIPLVTPFMTVRPMPQAKRLPNTQAILVTSANALSALPPSATPLLAVGDATAARARAAGFTTVHSAGRDAEALVALTRSLIDPNSGPLLLAAGARQGFATAAALRRAGYAVHRRVTYSATPVRRFPPAAESALRGDALYAALFLSAETAAAFVRTLPPALAPRLQNVLALAIGKPAAEALNPLPWRQVRLARTPTLDDVLAQL